MCSAACLLSVLVKHHTSGVRAGAPSVYGSLDNTTAHQGLLKDQHEPPIPLVVLGEAKGRRYTPEELTRQFSRALFPRTTNPYGCVTLHSYHFYVEQGVPQTQVLLWVYGEQLRAVLDNVVLAEYHCRTIGAPTKSRRSAMESSTPRALPRRKARSCRSRPRSHWYCIALRLAWRRPSSPSPHSN